MKLQKIHGKAALLSILIFGVTFSLNLFLQEVFHTETLIPTIFVLGVFLISWRTQGYFWGIAASCISVIAMNYVFTVPYYAFDFTTPECISTALVMLTVSILTGMLTAQIKRQEQLRAESQRERLRANLLRAVSHDLRTPLTSIYGASSTILENYKTLSDGQKLQLLEDVQEDSQWLIRMVENLLSVTRIDGGKVSLAKTPTVLEELIDAVLIKFHKRFPGQKVDVQIPEEFISIPMDAMLIEQVLINLLDNAVRHAEGMKTLSLMVTCLGSNVLFAVRDDGCGIPEQRFPDLFTGYLINRESSDGSRSNMGIGLSVCGAIIRAHGSEIFAKNLDPRGAEFSFTLKTEAQHEQ